MRLSSFTLSAEKLDQMNLLKVFCKGRLVHGLCKVELFSVLCFRCLRAAELLRDLQYLRVLCITETRWNNRS